jgi:opacity protein-like surface antigen
VNKIAKLLIVASGVVVATTAWAGGYDRDGHYYEGDGYRDHGRRSHEDNYNAYVGLNFGELRYHESGLDTITPTVAMVRVGASLASNLGIEARAGGGFGNSSTNGYGMSVQSLYAGYLKGSLPLAPGFSFYALGGVAAVNLQRDFGIGDTRDTGLSFGLGADFDLSGGATLNLEWSRLPDGNNLGYDYSNDVASIGVAWHF